MKIEKSFNVQIWVGLKERDTGKKHTIEDVYRICDEFVKDGDCVSVTKTNFRYTNGNEEGAIIGYINYPRFPRPWTEVLKRAEFLAENLMEELNQYKVTITTPNESIMLENDKLKE